MGVKYRMLLQYLGSRYQGWQIQGDRPTIQLALTEAIDRVCGERVSVVGSGRTDSGVHALGQVAHFRLSRLQPTLRLQRALNGVLPSDIRVMRLARSTKAFHAQKDARGKRYVYRIYDGPVLSPFLRDRVFHSHHRLQGSLMSAAAEAVLGNRDFSGFAAAKSSARSKERTVFRSEISRRGRHFTYTIEGDGFLHHMVRNIVGTLLQVGRRARPVSDMGEILSKRDRKLAGPTAAPWGLYLVRVFYGKR